MSTKRPLYVGIDLGTTNSAAAVFDGERVDLIRTAQGGTLTPSAVRIDARGKVTVGARARRFLDQDPDNVRVEFKRLMGSQQTLHFAASGLHKKPEELAAEVLRSIREDVKAQLGVLPGQAVISVPALFELPQIAATSEAARLAGFDRVEMIQEPVASGLGAGFRAEDDAGAFLVYDLGGGTFDVSLLESKEGLLRVVGHDGDNFLGGRDFDAALVDHVLACIRAESGVLIEHDDPAHAVTLRRVRAAAEEAKIELSRVNEADVVLNDLAVSGKTISTSLTIDRATLERLAEPLVLRTIAICRRLLSTHGIVEVPGVARVVLVGGPTAMPLLRARVGEALGAPFGEGLDPMTLVAEGAAYYAASSGLDARGSSAGPASAGAKVWLQFPAMSSDQTPFVVGRVVDGHDLSRISHIVVSRADGSWSSPKEPVDSDGTFTVMTSLLPRRSNELYIVGFGPGEVPVPLSPSELVIVHGVTLGDPPLSRSVGVALASNGVRVFFERGSPLPMRRTFALRTVEALSPQDPVGGLRVPIVQGEFNYAHLCRLIGAIEIKASQLEDTLPVNSLVEVTIELDRGGRLSASACLAQSKQIFEHVALLVAGTVSVEQLGPRLDLLVKRLDELRSQSFKLGVQRMIVTFATADELASDAARVVGSARGGDPDASERAQRLLIDLDSLLAEIENELAWPELDARARRGLASATRWVGEFGSPAEKQVLANALTSMEKARVARNSREVSVQLVTIRHLASNAIMRRPGAWQEEVDECAGKVAETRDPRAAAKLLDEARRAVDRQDVPDVERAVRAFWALLPGDPEDRQRGHSSGVS